MLNRLNHIAIALNSLDDGIKIYRDTFGAMISDRLALPKHGVTTIFVKLKNTNIELLEPLGENSPISKFLMKNPLGGIHHLCYEVNDINLKQYFYNKNAIVTGGRIKIGFQVAIKLLT